MFVKSRSSREKLELTTAFYCCPVSQQFPVKGNPDTTNIINTLTKLLKHTKTAKTARTLNVSTSYISEQQDYVQNTEQYETVW